MRLVKTTSEGKAKASELIEIMLFLAVSAVRLVNLSVRLVDASVRIVGTSMRLVDTSVRLVNRLVNAGVRSVRLLAIRVDTSVRLVLNLADMRSAVRSVNDSLGSGRRRLALSTAAGAAARLLAGFATGAAGARGIMRVVSVETTFIETSVLGLVVIEGAALGSVLLETAALGSVIIERATAGSVVIEAAASRLVVIEAAALGLVGIIAGVRVGSVSILNLMDNVDRLDRLKFVLSLAVGSVLLLSPRVAVFAAAVRTSMVLGSLSSGN